MVGPGGKLEQMGGGWKVRSVDALGAPLLLLLLLLHNLASAVIHAFA